VREVSAEPVLVSSADLDALISTNGGHRTMPLTLAIALAAALAAGAPHAPRTSAVSVQTRWVATWATAPQATEPANLPPAPGFSDTTLRQIVHVSIGGRTLRVRFSNAFGRTPLTIQAACVARAAGGHAIDPAADAVLTFAGHASVSIPEGASMVSDPANLEVAALSELAITIYVRGAPDVVTGHPGSRTTSYFQAGNAVSAATLSAAVPVDHWYFLAGIEVDATGRPASALAVLGDSITDGRGSTTNGNDRWPDVLSRRLRGAKATSDIAVLNLGIGGNRLLRDGLGPNVLARLDRDVLAQPGVRWLIVFEGINDIGTALAARAKGEPFATSDDVIGAYRQIVARAHAHGIRVFGGTIMAFEGFGMYFTPDIEAERQAINAWIRTSGWFDAVIDFDRMTRDPGQPTRLSGAVDGGDHLHPSAAGYRLMGEGIDLRLFR
jgi:lysophospholipase L1-like esterase